VTNTISPQDLWARIGTARAPDIIDVRNADDVSAAPVRIPGAIAKSHADVSHWAQAYSGRDVVVTCHRGLKLSQGVAAWLRHHRARALILEGGQVAWGDAGLPGVPIAEVPAPSTGGATVWVTRERPKIDRIACPWLIHRFVDPGAIFLFVAPSDVKGVADRFGATPFDIEDVRWSHQGELCTFDVMLDAFGLSTGPLQHLSRIVRGADRAQLNLEPQAAGLLAISLGLSRLFDDDLEQLNAGLILYDALYLWCVSGLGETHNWPGTRGS
jgi:rhodanese-related sulfurtransferase